MFAILPELLQWAPVSVNGSTLDPKGLEAVVALAQNLCQWAFLIIGGSVVILLGTSYRRPASSWIRRSFALFVPAWMCLAGSIYEGTQVQRAALGYYFLSNKNIKPVINEDAYSQIRCIQWGLVLLGIWLLIFLIWWISNKGKDLE